MVDTQVNERKEQGERFRLLLKEIRLTQNKIAEMLGTKQGSISHAINGNIGIPAKWLLLLKMWNQRIDTNWVLTGEGEMFLPAPGESPGDGLMEPDVAYVKGQARALSSEEVAVILARMQKEVADARAWRDEMERRLEDVSRRLEEIISGC